VGKAQEDFHVLKAKEAEKRLKVFKTALEAATKSGNFDKATALKERIAAYEADGARPRPKDVVKFGGHSYALITDKVTWHVAKKQCEEMGGHLVCFETPVEEKFVFDLCQQSGRILWLGATDEDDEGKWVWATGDFVSPAQADAWPLTSEDLQHHLHFSPGASAFRVGAAGSRCSFICEWNQ
jgi:hypothetical protein